MSPNNAHRRAASRQATGGSIGFVPDTIFNSALSVAKVDPVTVADWKTRLSGIIEHYEPINIFNCDETGLFYKLMPDRSLTVDKDDCKGGKKSKDRYTVMLCTNWAGTEKMKPLVIGK